MLPAYAGMIRCSAPVLCPCRRAPRVCGDDPYYLYDYTDILTVLPAYAGMIPRGRAVQQQFAGAPRVCGDDPDRDFVELGSGECSPRMRG